MLPFDLVSVGSSATSRPNRWFDMSLLLRRLNASLPRQPHDCEFPLRRLPADTILSLPQSHLHSHLLGLD